MCSWQCAVPCEAAPSSVSPPSPKTMSVQATRSPSKRARSLDSEPPPVSRRGRPSRESADPDGAGPNKGTVGESRDCAAGGDGWAAAGTGGEGRRGQGGAGAGTAGAQGAGKLTGSGRGRGTVKAPPGPLGRCKGGDKLAGRSGQGRVGGASGRGEGTGRKEGARGAGRRGREADGPDSKTASCDTLNGEATPGPVRAEATTQGAGGPSVGRSWS